VQNATDPLARAIEAVWNTIADAFRPVMEAVSDAFLTLSRSIEQPRFKRPLIHNGRKPRK
jgi:hypothetical protein